MHDVLIYFILWEYFQRRLKFKQGFLTSIIIIIIITIFIIITIVIIELKHSKTLLENTVEIEPQPVALDFKDLSQYSTRSK